MFYSLTAQILSVPFVSSRCVSVTRMQGDATSTFIELHSNMQNTRIFNFVPTWFLVNVEGTTVYFVFA